jgi:putative ABC transport system permease protein
MEQGIADSLKLKLGDTLTYDIAGTPVTARITSLRKVDWDSFRPNFFTLFAPGVLETMPQTYLGAVRLPEDTQSAAWLSAFVQPYPNVLAIDVGEIMRQVQAIIEQVSRAVEFVFLFTLLGGLLVLQAAIASTQDERRFDAAILRTLGASRAQLSAAQIAEFLVLGSLAGLLAAAGATATGYVLSDRVFQIPFSANPFVWVLGIGGSALTVTLAGWLGTRGMMRMPPSRYSPAGESGRRSGDPGASLSMGACGRCAHPARLYLASSHRAKHGRCATACRETGESEPTLKARPQTETAGTPVPDGLFAHCVDPGIVAAGDARRE